MSIDRCVNPMSRYIDDIIDNSKRYSNIVEEDKSDIMEKKDKENNQIDYKEASDLKETCNDKNQITYEDILQN